MKQLIYLLLLVFFSSSFLNLAVAMTEKNDPSAKRDFSEASKPSSDTGLIGTPSLYSAMKNIFSAYVNLVPFMSEPAKFVAKENETVILAHMSSMAITFRNEHTKKKIESGILQSSLLEMNDHMDQTIRVFTQGHKEFALNRVQATTQLCMSCHEQLPVSKKQFFIDFWGRFERDQFPSDFSFAEFNYLVQNYKKSTEYFLKVIKEQGEGRFDHLLYNSIQKIVLTYAYADFQPDELTNILKKIEKQTKLPKVSKENIQAWINTLAELKKDPLFSKAKLSEKELKTLLDKYREVFSAVEDEVLEIKLLTVAGKLKKFMTLNPKSPMAAEILYLSGMAERHIHRGLYFSFADIYLKSCILEYPKSPFAQKCYTAYEEGMIMGYTGSAGTELPPDVQAELKSLKEKIKK